MDMNVDASSDTPQPRPQVDDAYWSSLFEQEGNYAPPPVPETNEESWSTLNQRIDGRFRWADGGKPDTQDAWLSAQETFAADETLKLFINDFNKGGLIVQWNGLQGFIPASQLLNFPQFHVERERLEALKQWVNKTLQLKIIEVDADKKRLILSERAALVEADQRDALMQNIARGDILQGHITNLTKFGAFVDLGGIEGLIHISELSWSRVTHPSNIVKPGQAVTVQVLNINQDEERVALSMKQLKPDPWATVHERYEVGQIVEGVVSNVANFGAFVTLEDELEGLIHLSELAEGAFLHVRNVVRKGDLVRARILHVDGAEKRLALSLREAT
jgi:small subunit ribosomal protein S1